jgi:predicted Fe-Mo cluster-binding NifX family protein
VVADSDTMHMEVSANAAAQARGGAGPQAAQTLKGMGVEVVLTGQVGPNAEQALGAAGIEVVAGVTGKVRAAVEDYVAGKK